MRHGLVVPALVLVLLLASAAAAQAQQTINVTTTGDPTTAGDCATTDSSCSLRQAVVAASSGDTVDLPSGNYELTQGTDIDITQSITIEGNGVGSTSVDGSENSGSNPYGETARILRVDNATVTIEGLTFTGGVDGRDECSGCTETINENGGGALFNDGGNVTLDDVAFTENVSSAPLGGAVSTAYGTLSMTNVAFTHDSSGIAGALFVRNGTVTGNGVTFDDDTTTCCEGGAAYLLGGTVTLRNTTIVNSAALDSNPVIANGGANLTLDNDTLSDDGSDIQTDTSASTTVENTILGAPAEGSACEPPGRGDDSNGGTTGPAITIDRGYNIDQGASCGLDATGDQSNVDPKLAPVFDNGGPTPTEALLTGSPALGDPATTNCPTTDQRGQMRPDGTCDIGAFEAVVLPPAGGTPTASTGDSANVTETSADLSATINLRGEAGGFHFIYGTSEDKLTSSSPEAAAGIVSSDTPETETLSYLNPGTTYYYEAAADNATASTGAPNVEQFTTPPGPPLISNVNVDSVTDTTATIDFSIDPQGADTHYFIEYGPDSNYGQQTQPIDIGATSGVQNLSAALTGLNPDSSYDFQVFASNEVQQDVGGGDNQFNTDEQVTGAVGTQVTVTDSGITDGDCPSAQDTTVDWGDGSSDTNAQIQCQEGEEDETQYTLTDTHTYASAGHYLIQLEYGDLDSTTDKYAEIFPVVTNAGLPMISGPLQRGQTLTTTNGSWNGDPTSFDYQWLDCDENGQHCTETGDDAPSYTLTDDDVGETIEVTVSASNGGSEADVTSTPTQPVHPSAPTNTEPPAITGTAQQGQTLTTTKGSWDESPTGFAYQWQDCDANGDNCTDTGSDANTYALGPGDVGHTVDVVVTATNSAGPTHANSNRTAVVLAPSSRPASNPSAPSITTTAPTVSVTSAGFSGSVTPNGLPTQAYFQYALDPRYTGGGALVYDQSTQPQSVGSDFVTHTIGPVAVAGLLSNALYHVRLVAISSAGTTFGPDQTFTTEAAAAPGAPTLGRTVNVAPVSGLVLVKINGKFVPLTGLDQIPSGSQIDARHGSLELITSTGQKGKTQHGTFGGAIFRLTQERSGESKGLVTLSLLEGLFKGAPSYALCTKHKAGQASAAGASSKTLQLLHASAHGKFRTKGRYSAATVLGTKWTIADRCDGTLVHDITDSVLVNDFVRHRTITLHAGQSYLARAPK